MTFRIAHEQDGSHRYTMATGKLLGRATAGEGAVEEIDTATLLGVYVLKAGDTMTGNLGIGTTPDAGWAAGDRVLQLGATASLWGDGVAHVMSNNVYWNGTNFKYLTTAPATDYYQYNGVHTWRSAVSGTAGNNATLSTTMVLGATGNFASGGVTAPSGWGTGYRSLEVGRTGNGLWSNTANGQFGIVSNAYYDGASWRYANTDYAGYEYLSQANWYVAVAPSGTAGNAPTFTQLLQCGKDNSLSLQGATPQAGTGVTFPATQSASSNANTIDDYEEGTWTPSLTFGGAAVGMTYSVQSGTYTKMGRLVYVQFRILLTAKGSSTGACLIGGLPFTVATSSGVNGVMDPAGGMSGLTETIMGLCNGTNIYLMRSVARTQPTDTSFSNTSDIRFGGVYEV